MLFQKKKKNKIQFWLKRRIIIYNVTTKLIMQNKFKMLIGILILVRNSVNQIHCQRVNLFARK